MTVRAEAERQQRLLQALRGDVPATLALQLRTAPARQPRALQAYRANAGALAERALAAAFPTLQQLVGDDSFAALARVFWQHAPPERGDLAEWGAEFAAFVQADTALADVPYLADMARVDWAVHRAEAAADAVFEPAGLARLTEADPARLRLVLAPGAALIDSAHPVATLWLAHRRAADDGDDRFVPVRAALAEGRGETAFVWRAGWQGRVAALPAADAGFTRAVLGGHSLDAALDRAAPDFAFDAWLQRALGAGWLAGVADHAAPTA